MTARLGHIGRVGCHLDGGGLEDVRDLAGGVADGERDVEGAGVGGIRGGDDFLRSAQEMALLARAGKRPNDGAVLAACRKLLTDFDALVFDR